MEVLRFTDEYDLVAPVYRTTAAELRERDKQRGWPPRWLAIDRAAAVGAATAAVRPDRRVWLAFACTDPGAYGPLSDAAAEALGGPLATQVASEDTAARDALGAAGFARTIELESFRASFAAALRKLDRASAPPGFSIHPADQVDEARLFTLDNAIRNDVPGSGGWRGNRRDFHDELSESPPFDPAAYLVAVDDENGEYVGLVRIWRNRSGPRIGLIGVLRQYRNTLIAAALLQQALTAAAGWGHETFTTEASLENRITHRALVRLGAASLGRTVQLERRR